MVAVATVRPRGSMGEYPTVEICIKGFQYAIPEYPVALLKSLLPGVTEIFPVVEDNSIQMSYFGTPANIPKLPLLGALP